MKGALITAAAFATGVAALISTVVPGVDAAKPTPATLSISANPAAVKTGGSVTLSGKLTGSNVASRNVRVEQDVFPLGGGFDNAGSATTNATGDWSLVVKPTANTRFRAGSGKADSPTLDVMVRPSVTLKLSDRTPRRGRKVRFSGQVCPEHDTVAIALQRRTKSGWRTVASPVLADVPGATCSSFARRLRVRRSGAYRARFPGDADHAAGNSRVRRARVH
jgi:hypothetical protein